MVTRRAGAAKERLSREVVAASALAVADAEGLDALTIRRLASDHGVTPMALYWHFSDKEALLDGVAELVLAQIDLPDADPAVGWEIRLEQVLGALLAGLRAHPAVAEVVKTRILLSDPGLELTERVLGLLAEGGFDPEDAAQAAVFALVSIIGLVTAQPGAPVGDEDEDDLEHRVRAKRAALQALSPKRYPHVVAAADGLTGCGEPNAYFERGLQMLVAGIIGAGVPAAAGRAPRSAT